MTGRVRRDPVRVRANEDEKPGPAWRGPDRMVGGLEGSCIATTDSAWSGPRRPSMRRRSATAQHLMSGGRRPAGHTRRVLESLMQGVRGGDDATTRTRHRRQQPATPLHRRPVRYLVGVTLIAVGLVGVGLLAGWLLSSNIAATSMPSVATSDTSDPAAGTTLWVPDGPDAHPVSCGTSTHRVRSPVCDQAWAITAPGTG